MERDEVVEYVRRSDSDDEYDDVGFLFSCWCCLVFCILLIVKLRRRSNVISRTYVSYCYTMMQRHL